ncbi:MAG: DUF305 domain-containing protein, partial [Janthinobacterium lividum]
MPIINAGMMAKPAGDVDHDFVQMMVPHHQGTIDMAVAELRYSHNEQLKRIAQEIIVDQQQEIAAMRLALGQPLPPSVAVPTQPLPRVPNIPTCPTARINKMKHLALVAVLLAACGASAAYAGQTPGTAASPDIAISHHDRVYAAEQFSHRLGYRPGRQPVA